MEAIKNSVEELLDHTGELAESYYKLSVAKATEKAGKTAAAGGLALAAAGFAVVLLLLLGLGFAWWIGESMQNMKAGFFIVAGIYAFVFLLLVLFRRQWLVLPISNAIIRSVYDDDNQ
ncbi:MAG: phage holin family protein [Flavihumibacter sp.]